MMGTRRERESESAWEEPEIGGVKRVWGSRLKGAPQREGRGIIVERIMRGCEFLIGRI